MDGTKTPDSAKRIGVLEISKEYDGRILKTKTWTCIDCGAAYGNKPILLRLDDYKEFKL